MTIEKTPVKSLASDDLLSLPNEHRNFRWAYALLVELAKVELEAANAECGKAWPAGQEWEDLGATSKSEFLFRARDRVGIPHDEFLEGVRSGEYDV